MLLTLIAILTGLSWQGAGVQAREMPVAASISGVSALDTVRQAKAEAVMARPLAAGSYIARVVRADEPAEQGFTAPPGVRVRIDRAHE